MVTKTMTRSPIGRSIRAAWLFTLLTVPLACSGSAARRLDVAPTLAPREVGLSVQLSADSAMPPRGDQMIAGWMGSVVGGFVAWRIFDEPNGRHSHVKDDWGYTPRALRALGVGSTIGAALGVWTRGRANGSQGSLLLTSLGVAAASAPVWMSTDDPLLMLKVVAAWGPLQGAAGYAAYRASRRRLPGLPPAVEPVRLPDPVRRRSERLIVREELAKTSALNAYAAIRQLRPQWFTTTSRLRTPAQSEFFGKGGVIVVYLEDARYGTLEELEQLSLDGVTEVEYFGAVEATSRFGTGHPAGAIVVRMARSQ